jgi:hypothetical protein
VPGHHSYSYINAITNLHFTRTLFYLLYEREGKMQLGRPKRRRLDNIKIDLEELGLVGMGWIDLAHDRD